MGWEDWGDEDAQCEALLFLSEILRVVVRVWEKRSEWVGGYFWVRHVRVLIGVS